MSTEDFFRRRRWLPIVGVSIGALALAACGSNLDPNQVVGAVGGGQGGAAQGSLGGETLPGTDGQGLGDDTQSINDQHTGTGAAGNDTGVGGSTGSGGATGDGSTPADGVAGPAGGSGGPGGAGGTAPAGSGGNAADGGTKAASCAGFQNSTGITDKEITVSNISDISGPVPGIFESAQEATRAYASYFNSASSICGRKLKVELLDSRADAGADQQAATKACASSFATVGSMSAFDSGGAATTAGCGMPDIRSTIVNPQRNACKTCFAAQAINPSQVASSIPKFFTKSFPSAAEHAAMLYINAGAAPVNAQGAASVYAKNGMGMDYVKGIDVSEFNYAPYVQDMKNKGIKFVQYMGPYQNAVKLKQTMRQQGMSPDVFLLDATAYDPRYVKSVGGDGDGTFVFMNNEMFSSANPEMKLYLAWLQQVKPGAVPTFYGLYAWSATRLFVEESLKLGGKLNRANLVSSLSRVKDWNDNGAHAPMQVGGKSTSGCTRIIKLSGGNWSQISSGSYLCGPLTSAN